MTVQRIQSMREFCIQNRQLIEDDAIFSLTLSSKDIDGGLNFEEEINYYRIGNQCWQCEHVIEKTVQPAFGSTITSQREKSIHELTDDIMLRVLNEYPEALKSFEAYEQALVAKGYCVQA